ncbi:translation elongation factor Ts [Roseisolibacter sp. H3M3-2]|uniref:translation elongation factor Ts n=1 Tax=Roseisolibacter sp. H3M3-2 TaxID=3031323 RepID=UPI0023DAE1EB|nr:translation elongation factor Ts [Roseisolibacter sp. H3M3-2]MDF1504697.1 translation elongation factor Ts [Roseisolibacter sp. H3M3-2]
MTATFTAKDVQELRQRTGAGMMDCKKALEENQGNMEAAVDYLRKKGIAKAEKRAGRTASEGAVMVEVAPDGTSGVMVEVNSETDFVSRNADFQALARSIAQHAHATAGAGDATTLLAAPVASKGGSSLETVVKEASAVMGEALQLRRAVRFDAPKGAVGSYVHFNGKIGVLVEVEAANGAQGEELVKLASVLAEHVAAAAPLGVDESTIPADVIAKEREIAMERTRAEGKPEAMLEKIVDGKIKAYYKEVALVHQMWVREPKTPISQVVADAGKKVGGAVTVKRFARFQLGQE